MQKERRVICWDLDETLGSFRKIVMPDDWETPVSLRYGMADLLKELSDDNYLHFVTTSGSFEYARTVLIRTGLESYFSGVFGDDLIGSRYGKQYRPVAEKVSFNDGDMVARGIVVGDLGGDQPVDIAGLVFVEVGNMNLDAVVIKKILSELLDKGNGNFKAGFEMLYSLSQESNPGKRDFSEKVYKMDSGIILRLEYRNSPLIDEPGQESIPVVYGIEADNYIRESKILEQ